MYSHLTPDVAGSRIREDIERAARYRSAHDDPAAEPVEAATVVRWRRRAPRAAALPECAPGGTHAARA